MHWGLWIELATNRPLNTMESILQYLHQNTKYQLGFLMGINNMAYGAQNMHLDKEKQEEKDGKKSSKQCRGIRKKKTNVLEKVNKRKIIRGRKKENVCKTKIYINKGNSF
jgi:hypothetical protein